MTANHDDFFSRFVFGWRQCRSHTSLIKLNLACYTHLIIDQVDINGDIISIVGGGAPMVMALKWEIMSIKLISWVLLRSAVVDANIDNSIHAYWWKKKQKISIQLFTFPNNINIIVQISTIQFLLRIFSLGTTQNSKWIKHSAYKTCYWMRISFLLSYYANWINDLHERRRKK